MLRMTYHGYLMAEKYAKHYNLNTVPITWRVRYRLTHMYMKEILKILFY